MGPSKEGQLLDGYTIKTHIFIFCKRRIAMKNQKRSGKQNGAERFSAVKAQNIAKA